MSIEPSQPERSKFSVTSFARYIESAITFLSFRAALKASDSSSALMSAIFFSLCFATFDSIADKNSVILGMVSSVELKFSAHLRGLNLPAVSKNVVVAVSLAINCEIIPPFSL